MVEFKKDSDRKAEQSKTRGKMTRQEHVQGILQCVPSLRAIYSVKLQRDITNWGFLYKKIKQQGICWYKTWRLNERFFFLNEENVLTDWRKYVLCLKLLIQWTHNMIFYFIFIFCCLFYHLFYHGMKLLKENWNKVHIFTIWQ